MIARLLLAGWIVGCAPLEAGPARYPAVDAIADVEPASLDGTPPAGRDGAVPDGGTAGGPDGQIGTDAAELDAEVGEPDAEVGEPDAMGAEDAGFGACVVEGVGGECLPTAACAAPGRPVPGFCPGPRDIQCCVALPARADCDPAAHPQPNAGLEEAPGDPGCPPGMAVVGAVCVDRYEAALVEVTAEGARPWSPFHHPGARSVRAVSLAGAVPQGYIDGHTAGAACAAAGKRLCSDAEWLRACRGEEGRTWPYGDPHQPGWCNDARARHPAVELFPDDPDPFARIQHPCINQLADGLASTGAHAECVTPEGVFDLAGNLHEWTADPDGTFRGGFYVDTQRNGPGCLYRTTAHGLGHWDYSTGFRCCADRR